MIGLLGKKIGMTQVFKESGMLVPVTVIEVGSCHVISVKEDKAGGRRAVRLCFDEVKPARVNKPVTGMFKKANLSPHRLIREFSLSPQDVCESGQVLKADFFIKGEYIDVIGTSIGKGFQGGMKRWHWKGGPRSHGSTSHRRPGSIGSSSSPSRVFKGHHLPGHMGNRRITVQNLEVVNIDAQNNLLLVKGAVPGPKKGVVLVRGA